MKRLAFLSIIPLLFATPSLAADLDGPVYRERETYIERPPRVVERPYYVPAPAYEYYEEEPVYSYRYYPRRYAYHYGRPYHFYPRWRHYHHRHHWRRW